MKKKLFVLILSIFIVLPFAMLFSGCEEQDFIGISAQNSRQKISYGQEFDPVERFNVRSHYLNGKAETLTAQDLTYTIVKDEEIYELDEYFDCGFYTFEFTYNDSTCHAYLTVSKVDYTREDVVEIENFAVNRKVSMPTLYTLSDGDVNFYYKHANKPTEQEQVWLYEEDDINENIAPGDYLIYAKVDEGTNYKAYKTESTQFHVSPEPLDESYSISSNIVNTTYIPFGKLTDYETILNENVKLNYSNPETGETEIISGSFGFGKTSTVKFDDSGKSFYIYFNSEDQTLNGKEFQITMNLSKYIVAIPVLTLDETKSEIIHVVDYNENPHSVYFVDDTNVLIENEHYYLVDNRNTKIAGINGSMVETLPGLYETHIALLDTDGGVCWSDNTTDTIDFFWDVNKIVVPDDEFELYIKLLVNTEKIISGSEISPDCTEEDFIYIKKGDIIPLLSKTYIIPYDNGTNHYSTQTLHHYMFFGIFEKNGNNEYIPFNHYTTAEVVVKTNKEFTVLSEKVKISGNDEVVGVCLTLHEIIAYQELDLYANLVGNEIYKDCQIEMKVIIGE